jgi:fibronectin type 3 domain-containing protein
MANPGSIYGRYRIVDELFRTAYGSVSTAVRADDPAQSDLSQTCIVKVYDPDFEVSSEDAALFLKKAEVQQQASASGKNWGPIHELGRSAEGKPFYVTNYYPRSAQRLISGRVNLPPTGLQEITYAIISGLMEMKQICGRSHGNIKPSNILIGGRGAVADVKVVLCDPSGDACVGVDAEAEDVRAVGGIIYQLVMHRPFPRAAWPVADAEQWKRLRRWRELCSKLLDPSSRTLPTLADVEQEVRLLGGRKIGRAVGRIGKSLAGPRLITKRRMILAAAVLAAAGAGVGVLRWEESVKAEVVKSKAELDQMLPVLDDPANGRLFESGSYSTALQQDKTARDLVENALAVNGWKSLLPATILNVRKAQSAAADCRAAWEKAFLEDPLRANSSGPKLPAWHENPTGSDIVKDVFKLQQAWATALQSELKEINAFLLQLDQHPDLFASGPYAACLGSDKAARDLVALALPRCQQVIDARPAVPQSAALGSSDIRTLNQARTAAGQRRSAWSDAFAHDPRRSVLSNRIEEARKRAWKIPNEQFVPDLPEPPNADSIVTGVEQLDKLSKRLDANDPSVAWNDFEKKLQGIAGTGLFGGFATCLRDEVARKIALAETGWLYPPDLFEQYGAMAGQLASIMKNSGPGIDFERMKRDEPGMHLDHPTVDAIAPFIAKADKYVKAESNARTSLKNELKPVLAKIDGNPKEWPASGDPSYSGYVRDRAAVDRAIEDLDKEKTSYIRRDVDEDKASNFIESKRKSINADIASIYTKYNGDTPKVDLTEFVTHEIDEKLNVKEPQLRAIKDKQVSELKNVKELYRTRAAEDLKKKLRSWAAAMEELDKFYMPANLSDPYKTIAAERRDKIWQNLLAQMQKPPGPACLTESAASAESDEFAKWCKTLTALATALPAFRDNHVIELAAFETFEAQWSGSGNPGQSNFWQTEVLPPTAPLHAVAASLLPRFDRLRAIEKADPAKLAAEAIAPPDFTSAEKAELFFAAWQRLGGAGQFAAPLSIKELGNEAALRTHLAAARDALEKNTFLASQTLKDDLTSALKPGPARWCDAFKAAASGQDIAALMAARGAFGVDDALRLNPAILAPASSYNFYLWLAQQALAKNDPAAKTQLDSLAIVAAALPEPFKAHGERLARWLNAQPCTPDLLPAFGAVLNDSAYCLGTKPPDLMASVLAAAEMLRAKSPNAALLLSAGFHDREPAAVSDNAALWAKSFLDLANAFQTETDKPREIIALKHGVRLEDPAAMAMLVQVAPKIAIEELTPVQAKLDGATLILVAKVYEFGSSDKQIAISKSSAREWYTAAEKKSKEAQDWILKNPDPGLTPNNVIATARPAGGIDLTWKWPHDRDKDAQFRIYRTASLGGQVTAQLTKTPIKETRFSDDSAPAGSTCFYQIAVVLKGVEGGSTPASADPYPPRPSELLATPILAGGIKLTWKPVTDDSSLKGYNISRAATPTGTFARLTASPVAAASYVDQQAAPGATSYYKITAVDKLREGIESNSPDANATAYLPVPANAHADMIAGGSIRVTWDAMTTPAPKNYVVYRANTKGEFTKLDDVAKSKNLYEDTAPQAGINFYAIAALDTLDREGSRASASAESLPAVAGLTPTVNGRKIVVKWSPAGSANVAGYAVSRSNSPNGPWTPLTRMKSRNDVQYEDPAPTEGANYYAIAAFNASLVEGKAAHSSEIVLLRQSATTVPTTVVATPPKPRPGSDYYARGKEEYLAAKWAEARKDFNQAIALGYTEKPSAFEDSAATYLTRMDQKERTDKEKAEKEKADKAKADALAASKLPIPKLDPPDLTLTPFLKGGGIKLTWTDNDPSVTDYMIYRGGLFLRKVGKSVTEFEDAVRPGTYEYYIDAVNDSGKSRLSEKKRATAQPKIITN